MRPDLDQKLCETFPLLYADRKGSARETSMCWGFACSDGWFDLLWNLSSQVEPLIVKWIEENPEFADQHPKASQVKEKFGTLRFYMNGATEEMYKHINAAEHLSAISCEECGAPGKTRKGGWLAVLCDDHSNSRPTFDDEDSGDA